MDQVNQAVSPHMEVLNKVAKFLVSPPMASTNLTLEELQGMSILQRVQAQSWSLELLVFAAISVLVVSFKLGDWYNSRLANNFFNGLSPVLDENFAQVGVSPNPTDAKLAKDTAENFSGYATGRENISSVVFDINLQARQNFLVWGMEYILSFFFTGVIIPEDKCDITVTPSGGYDNFIAAIVNKNGMNDYRQKNYYLSLTTTNDSSVLPVEFVHMVEVNELAEKITIDKIKDNLIPEIRYLAFTDLQVARPENIIDLAPKRKVVLSVDIVNDKQKLAKLNKVIEGIFDVIDGLTDGVIAIRPETIKKVVKTRDNEVAKMKKLLEDDRELQKQDALAAKQRQERDARRKLSREEQLKLEKKEQEKKQKKLMKKQRVRM